MKVLLKKIVQNACIWGLKSINIVPIYGLKMAAKYCEVV